MLDYSKLGAMAAEGDDLTKNKEFERELPREGIAMLRYVGYLETGKHVPTNPQHKAAHKVIHIFELNHRDHLIKLENGDMMPTRMYVHQSKGSTAKSNYRKLFNIMNIACGNKHKHFVEMLGKGFLGEVFHSEWEKKKYANLHLDGAWSIKAPFQTDVLTGQKTPIPIPEVSGDIQCFLWENDAVTDEDLKTMWEALYIEGVRDDKSSKNWIQEAIMDNIEWEGSRTQSLTQDFVGLDEEDAGIEDLAGLNGDDIPY